MKKCKECNENKNFTEFYKVGKYFATYCKVCEKEKKQLHKLSNPQSYKEANKRFRIKNVDYDKQYKQQYKLNHTIVYLLPEDNYVGITNNPYIRMGKHKHEGRNVDNYRVLYQTKSREEALELEELLHDLGYEGKNPNLT